MDAEFKPPLQENGAKNEEDLVQKDKAPPDVDTNGTMNESPKHNSRPKRGQRRSRSRTPQQKCDDAKTLQVSLKKLNTELNGKDLKEETEKTEVEKEDTTNDIEKKEDKDAEKINEELNKSGKQSKKHQQEKSKKEEGASKDDNREIQEPAKEPAKTVESPKKATPKKEKKDKTKKQETSATNDVESDTVEMDPLIISDEPDPELVFDENSDMESGKGSPLIPRCATRRSQTRNIPTPKTPKSVDQDVDSEKKSVATSMENYTELPTTEILNDTQDSMDTANLSTMVIIGSDDTRVDYIKNHSSNLTDDLSYLNASRERSLGETLRSLSARRPIRPTDDYRRKAIRLNQEKSDLNLPYHSEDIMTGLKRKNRSITPEDRKKFKTDSPVLNSVFSSPLSNLRNKFRSDLPSSTPKLLGFKDGKSELHYNDEQNMVHSADDEKKSWCSVM